MKRGDHVKTPDGFVGRVVAFPTRTGQWPLVTVQFDPGQEERGVSTLGIATYPRYLLSYLHEEEGPDDD